MKSIRIFKLHSSYWMVFHISRLWKMKKMYEIFNVNFFLSKNVHGTFFTVSVYYFLRKWILRSNRWTNAKSVSLGTLPNEPTELTLNPFLICWKICKIKSFLYFRPYLPSKTKLNNSLSKIRLKTVHREITQFPLQITHERLTLNESTARNNIYDY